MWEKWQVGDERIISENLSWPLEHRKGWVERLGWDDTEGTLEGSLSKNTV